MTFGGIYRALPDERGFVGSKVGGRLAVALPCEVPTCTCCGKPMRFLLQLALGPKVYPPYRMAVVLICEDPHAYSNPYSWCDTATAGGGGNAVILLEKPIPCDTFGPAPGTQRRMASVSSAHEVLWEPTPDFFRMPSLGGAGDSEEDVREGEMLGAFEDRFGLTKLGGWPIYIYNDTKPPACPACGGETTFIASFDARLPAPPGGESSCLEEFGDCGVGYLFLCDARCGPRGGAFEWQCS